LVGGEGFAVDASLIVADANKQRSIPGSEWNKVREAHGASRAMREYLATLDDAAFGAASEVVPKFVSPSDPAAQWTGAMRGPAFFAYADNYLIDVKFGIIMDVQARIMHQVARFCMRVDQARGSDPSGWIGVRGLGVQRVWC
jgi:hypothetical protein